MYYQPFSDYKYCSIQSDIKSNVYSFTFKPYVLLQQKPSHSDTEQEPPLFPQGGQQSAGSNFQTELFYLRLWFQKKKKVLSSRETINHGSVLGSHSKSQIFGSGTLLLTSALNTTRKVKP